MYGSIFLGGCMWVGVYVSGCVYVTGYVTCKWLDVYVTDYMDVCMHDFVDGCMCLHRMCVTICVHVYSIYV